jgi:small subunit ribosomal protein S14
MARKALIAKEAQRRATVAKYAEKRRRLKAEGKWEELQKLPRDASPVRLKNRCALTGRPRGYLRKFGVCRNVFREMSLDGKIPGVRKSSW